MSLLNNVKPRIKKHSKSAIQEWCTEFTNREQLEASLVQDVGLTFGRFALNTIREAMSYSSSEMSVFRHYLNGGDWGAFVIGVTL